jgi:hypothetical protein
MSILLGTNLFHYTTREMGMAHPFSFCLFAWLLYYLPVYFRRPGVSQSLILGVILGWLFLIRPTNGIVFLLLLGYDMYSWASFRTRIRFFMQRPVSIFCIGIAAFIMVFPQLLYWKEMTGQWIYYSYTEEGFIYWKNPRIAAVLFDVQNGLFLYSPLVLLMMAGIGLGLVQKRFHAPVLLIIFALVTYAFASWWAWWFGGAFGHRSYIEYYAIWAIPLAGLYHWIWNRTKSFWRYPFLILTICMMIYSVRLSYLYTSIGGPWDGADWRWNWEKYQWIMSHFFGAPG